MTVPLHIRISEDLHDRIHAEFRRSRRPDGPTVFMADLLRELLDEALTRREAEIPDRAT
jgi:hypothetical protein